MTRNPCVQSLIAVCSIVWGPIFQTAITFCGGATCLARRKICVCALLSVQGGRGRGGCPSNLIIGGMLSFMCTLHISRGRYHLRQRGGFSRVGAIVASFESPGCPIGRYVGYIWKALEKGYWEHPGSTCCTDKLFEIFVRFGRCLCCLLPLVHKQPPCCCINSLTGCCLPRCTPETFGSQKSTLWGCKVGASYPAYICQPTKKAL